MYGMIANNTCTTIQKMMLVTICYNSAFYNEKKLIHYSLI